MEPVIFLNTKICSGDKGKYDERGITVPFIFIEFNGEIFPPHSL